MRRITAEVRCYLVSSPHLPCQASSSLPAVACEVLARKIVHLFPRDKLTDVMSTRYQHLQPDGDVSDTASALEMAIDQNWCVLWLSEV